MNSLESPDELKPIRKTIFRHSLVIIGLFALLGIFMSISVYLASGMTPKLIHVNYDSIAAAIQMNTAWKALRHPEDSPNIPEQQWIAQFDQALRFEEGNITEPGEDQITKSVRELWSIARKDPHRIDLAAYSRMEAYLDQLIAANEKGMFRLAEESLSLNRGAFAITTVLFLFSIFLALYLADNLSVKIATPLKDLAETLRHKPFPGSKLKLPRPSSLEMRIFTHEMTRLWERLSKLQKLNLEEISSQRNKMEAVLASVDDAILVLDNENRVVHCNPGMLKLLGATLGEILGQPWNDISSASENYLKLREVIQPHITSEQSAELELDQKKRVFAGRCRPFFGERGTQIGSIYLLHDITEIRQRDRLKAEFIGVLSHELKTPLQSLGTAAEILFDRRSKMDSDEQMLIETIHEDAGRIRGVANEFVQVGLVDFHSLKLRIENVPVSDYFQQWIQPFQILAKDRQVNVRFVKEGSEIIFGKIDIVKFPWSISNLISNAIRVSPPKSEVTVYLTDREGRLDIEVRDEGPGIPEETQKRMFDPYFQGRSDQSGFLGLGLTICKEVVEAHEGRIEYFSRLPHGSIFRISLPLSNLHGNDPEGAAGP